MMSGDKILEHNDKSILKKPIGVCFDKSSNICVASNGNTINIISFEGNFARCILGKEDGINRPFGIYINIERYNLFVSSFDGTVIYRNCHNAYSRSYLEFVTLISQQKHTIC